MNDAEAEAQKARVLAAYQRWGVPLGLGWQRKVAFAWHRGSIPGDEGALMVCRADWQYKSATVAVDLLRVAAVDDGDDLDFVMVHELMHVFLDGLVEAHRKEVDGVAFRLIEEHTASTLAQAILWLRGHCEGGEAT